MIPTILFAIFQCAGLLCYLCDSIRLNRDVCVCVGILSVGLNLMSCTFLTC